MLIQNYHLNLNKNRKLYQSSLKNQTNYPDSPISHLDRQSTDLRPFQSLKNSEQISAEQAKALLLQNQSHEFYNYHKEQQTMHFLFAALILDRALVKFPRSNELRIHSSLLQSELLTNEFKAVFELMKCSKGGTGGNHDSFDQDTSLANSFQIFRRQIMIERRVKQKCIENAKVAGRVDPIKAYKYEK